MSPQQWTPPTSDKQAWTPPAADAQAAKPIPGNTPEERRQYLIAHPDAAKANREATSAPFQSKEPEGSAAGRFLEGLVSPITGPAREIWQFVSDHDAWVRQHGGNSQNDLMSLPGAPQAMQAGTGDVAGAVGGTVGQVGLAALQAKMAGPRILNERGAPGMPAALESIDTALRTAADPGVVRAGVKVLPKGPAAVAAYDAVQTARARIAAERMGPAPASWNGTPVNAWEGMPEAAAPVAAAETPGQALARQSNTDWSKLSPTDQALLEQVAKAQQNVAAQPARAPMGPPAAAAPVEAAPRGQTLAEMLAAEFDARKAAEPAVSSPPIGAHPASPPINGRGAPLRPPLAQGPVEAPPVVEAPPTPARVRMSPDELKAAEDDMAATPPAPGDPQPGRSQYYPNGEAKSPQVLVQEGIRYARTQKAGKLAQALADSGVNSEAAANMKAADWKALAEKNDFTWAKGEHGDTIAETLFNLRKLEAQTVKGVEASTPPSEVVDAPRSEPAPEAAPKDGGGWKDGKYFVEEIASADPGKKFVINQLRDGSYQPQTTSNGSTFSNYKFDSLKEARAQVQQWNAEYADVQSGAAANRAAFAARMEPTVTKLVDAYKAGGPEAAQAEFNKAATDLGTSEAAALRKQFQESLKASGADLSQLSKRVKPGASTTPPEGESAPPVSKEEAAFNKRKAARDKKKKP